MNNLLHAKFEKKTYSALNTWFATIGLTIRVLTRKNAFLLARRTARRARKITSVTTNQSLSTFFLTFDVKTAMQTFRTASLASVSTASIVWLKQKSARLLTIRQHVRWGNWRTTMRETLRNNAKCSILLLVYLSWIFCKVL